MRTYRNRNFSGSLSLAREGAESSGRSGKKGDGGDELHDKLFC